MSDGDDGRTVRIHVKGRVQGVGFRFFALREADRIGVKGYVRNMPDGSVEAVAAGGKPAVDEFVRLLAAGPPSARVRDVAVEEAPGQGPFDRFEIKF